MDTHYVRTFNFSIYVLLATCLLGIPFSSQAQFIEEYNFPQDAFSQPLELPMRLSGTFGEPRGSHFHAGLDLKTNGSTGHKVFCVADGYISRVKVSPYGYGNALYIDHPNGYTSVYAHLEEFSDTLNAYIRQKQYQRQSFEQDIYFRPGDFNVKNGELIGLSGNSGGSGGPHLHFEIRHSSTQIPINPLLFGYKVEDDKKPFSGYVRIKNVDRGVYANDGQKFSLVKRDSFLTTSTDVKVEAGKIGIAAHAYDQQTHSTNKNGVFRMTMKVNGQDHFQWTVDEIPFDQGRYVNALMDYKDKKTNSLSMHQCFLLPTNNLSIYENVVDEGYIDILEGEEKNVIITILDFANNKTYIKVKLIGTPKVDHSEDDSWNPNQNQSIIKENFRAHFPARIFYDKVQINYSVDSLDKKQNYSFVHQLSDEIIPLQKYVVIEIKPTKTIKHKDKVVLFEKPIEGGTSYLNAYWNDGFVSAKTRSLGSYTIQLDTIAPDIKLLNYSSQSKTFRDNSIRIHGKDNMSGIKNCQAFIDGQWVLLEYDAKRNLFIYHFDKYCPKGDHELLIKAEDQVGNIFEKTYSFKN